VQHDLHLTDVHDAQAFGIRIQLAANRHLRKRETSVASLPAKTRVPRFLVICAHPAKERLERQINAYYNVLQDLRLHTSKRWSLRLEGEQCSLLVVEPNRLLALLPGISSLSEQMIVQPAALLKLLLKEMR